MNDFCYEMALRAPVISLSHYRLKGEVATVSIVLSIVN